MTLLPREVVVSENAKSVLNISWSAVEVSTGKTTVDQRWPHTLHINAHMHVYTEPSFPMKSLSDSRL